MKTIWDADDIEPGRIVTRIKPDATLTAMSVGSKADSLFIISTGYIKGGDEKGKVFYLTPFSDGMQMHAFKTREGLAQHMTEDNYRPLSGADKDKIIEKAAKVAVTVR